MTIVVFICAGLILAAAVMALLRVEKGPTILDRTVALDVFTAVLVGAIALEAAWHRRTDTLPILVVLSMVGFIGSVTVSRFVALESAEEGRIQPGGARRRLFRAAPRRRAPADENAAGRPGGPADGHADGGLR